MIVRVLEAYYLNEFKLSLSLQISNNGQKEVIQKEVDMSEYLSNKKRDGLFAPLKNEEYFKNFKLNANTIEWENGVDIAPERFLEL